MIIFRNFKNQSALCNHIWYHVSQMSINQFEILFKTQCTVVKKLKNTPIIKMGKKRQKIALAVLSAVRSTFLKTNKFIDSTLRGECEKERMTVDEVTFSYF